MSLTAIERAKRIKVILFDVDGVLTNGQIWLFPAPAGTANAATAAGIEKMADKGGSTVEAKGFCAHDGTSISMARLGGMKCGVITKRISETVALRARDLRLEFIYQGQAHKMNAINEIMAKEGITLEEIAYVGDDIIDLPVMRVCGLAIAVKNARPLVKQTAHYTTENAGGEGAGRDAVEFILAAKGLLEKVTEEYIDERSEAAAAADIGQGGM
jgi:3-deoxy-D-manno-octulosonate 8-phosphate phosphatase (KDO 8-P phosphatase)